MASPVLATISENGTIFMYDYKYGKHYAFDESGNLKADFGAKGEGPGEVRFPRGYFSVNNQLIVFDLPKLHYFSIDGKYLKTIPIIKRSDRPGVMVNENEYISYPRSDEGEIAYVNIEKGSHDVLKKITSYKSATRISRRAAIVVPWVHTEFVGDYDIQNSRLYYGINDKYSINVLDLSGKKINTFKLKRKKRKITPEMEKMYEERNPSESGMLSSQKKKSIPQELSYYRKIQILNGGVYVFVTNFGEHWNEQQIDIFSLDGNYIYRTVFKPVDGEMIYSSSLFPSVFLKGDYLYTLIIDKDDDYKLVKYHIALPAL